MITVFYSWEMISDTRSDSPLRALPSSADACRGSVGFQSASAGRLLLPSSDGAFCSPGLFCPSSGWSRPPRRPSSICPCQIMLAFHSSSACARGPIPPPLQPFSCSPVPLEPVPPPRFPSEGERTLRSSGWGSQAGFIRKSESKWGLPWLHGLLLPLMTPPPPPPPPTPALTGSVWPFFT